MKLPQTATQIHAAQTRMYPAKTPQRNTLLVSSLFLLLAIPGIPAIFIVLLVLFGPFESPMLMSLVNARYFETPWPLLLHGGSSVAFFLTVPWQFSPTFRQKAPGWHRNSGRVALLSAYMMAISAIWMHHSLTPDELGMRYVGLLLMSFGIVLTFSLAFYYVLQGQISAHRRWMYRAMAIVLAAVTPLFLGVIADLTLGQLVLFKTLLPSLMHDYGRLAGMLLNLLVAQWLLRQKA
jgi:uncharacterized membrane protein